MSVECEGVLGGVVCIAPAPFPSPLSSMLVSEQSTRLLTLQILSQDLLSGVFLFRVFLFKFLLFSVFLFKFLLLL